MGSLIRFPASSVTDSLLLTFLFPWGSWIVLPVTDSLLLTFCFPRGFLILLPASRGWPTLFVDSCWLSVSRSWSPCLLCCCAGDWLCLMGSRLGHLGRLARVTESDFALFWTAPSFALSPLERSLLFFSYFFPRTTFLYLKVLIFSLASRLQLPLLLSYLSQLLLIELPVPTSLERFLLMSYPVPWATSSVKRPVPYLSSKYLFSSGIIAPLNQHFVLAIYPFFSWPAE